MPDLGGDALEGHLLCVTYQVPTYLPSRYQKNCLLLCKGGGGGRGWMRWDLYYKMYIVSVLKYLCMYIHGTYIVECPQRE